MTSNEDEKEKEQQEKPPSPRPIFRKVSLERLANPEQLDNLLVVVTSKIWITLYSLLFLTAILLMWLFFGIIPIQVQGRGVVMNSQGLQFYIPAKLGGVIHRIYVKPNEFIEKGAPIAEVFDFQEELKRKNVSVKMATLQEELEKIQLQMQSDASDKSRVKQLEGELREIKAEQSLLLEENAVLEESLPYYKIYSESSGHILEVLSMEGDYVTSGDPLVWVEKVKSEHFFHDIYGYFHVEDGKKLSVGQNVKIKLSTVDSQEYGYLTGTIKQISDYAVSKQSIVKMVHSRELADYLVWDNQAVVQVLIAIETKPGILPGMPEQYYWTSGKTPPIAVSAGTVCEIQAVAGGIAPIFYLLPLDFLKLPGEK